LGADNCCNGVLWLALFIEIALASVLALIAVAPRVVVITPREAIMLLLLLVIPL
jgi:hypothetical protein